MPNFKLPIQYDGTDFHGVADAGKRPLEADCRSSADRIGKYEIPTYQPDACPLCESGVAYKPGSRK